MNSKTTLAFRKRLAELPPEIQTQARADYRLFQRDPNYAGLHFQKIARGSETLYSVRTGLHYRALATMENSELVWFWIGHHSVYDKILAGR